MRRWLGWIAIGWMLALCALALLFYGSPASHLSLDDRTLVVAQQLRCPMCQGESVAASQSDIARAMRGVIRARLRQGESAQAIEAYFVSRYGSWILLSPPSSGIGAVAWLAPPLLVLAGIGLLVTLVTGWRTKGEMATVEGGETYLERVRAELAAQSRGE